MEVLSGKLYLSDIRKDAIQQDQRGKFIWVDVVARRTPSRYGDTHSITHWDKGSTQYLASLRPRIVVTRGGGATSAPKAAPSRDAEDMPEDLY